MTNEDILNKLNEGGIMGFKGTIKDGAVCDADGVTLPNIGLPVEVLNYIDPRAVEAVLAPRVAEKMFPAVIMGDWATNAIRYRLEESLVGAAAPYSDFSEAGVVDINQNWLRQDVFRGQVVLQAGSLEETANSKAKINLLAGKQRSAALALAVFMNQVFMNGIRGLQIFGIKNNPNLPAAIPSQTVSGNSTWESKGCQDIFSDIIKLFTLLTKNSAGHVDANSPLVLAVSPALNGCLSKVNQFGQSVHKLIKDQFPNSEIIVVPEFATQAGDLFYMYCREIDGIPTGECVSQVKLSAGPAVQGLSSIKQKYHCAVSGYRCLYPFGIARMLVS